MDQAEPSAPGTVTPSAYWDPFVAELRAFRERRGSPSYETIARAVGDARLASGMAPHTARVARSTVYDAFKAGRPRVNVPFLREIASAMGATDTQVEEWVRACDPPEPPTETARDTSRQVRLLLLGCVVVNLLGRLFVDFFDLPVYLDMVGTAVAAIALGPWRGAAVGATTNIVGVALSGWISLPFAIVNVAGALVWGYGIRRFAMGGSLPRFLSLNALTALVCTALAVPIVVLSGMHDLRVGHDVVTQLVARSTDTFVVAASLANILTSLADKLLSGFLALVVLSVLPKAFSQDFPLGLVVHASDMRPPD